MQTSRDKTEFLPGTLQQEPPTAKSQSVKVHAERSIFTPPAYVPSSFAPALKSDVPLSTGRTSTKCRRSCLYLDEWECLDSVEKRTL